MKRCPTCGIEHPDDVTTSHHPPDCTCGSILCGGCIWCRTVQVDMSLPSELRQLDALLGYLALIMEREQAGQKQAAKDGRIVFEFPEERTE